MKYLGQLLLLICFSASAHLSAEQVRIPIGPQENQWAADIPRRAMTKNQVENTYGSPDSKHGPTGTPPISYWEYPSYTVYFEYNHVLHTVSKLPKVPN